MYASVNTPPPPPPHNILKRVGSISNQIRLLWRIRKNGRVIKTFIFMFKFERIIKYSWRYRYRVWRLDISDEFRRWGMISNDVIRPCVRWPNQWKDGIVGSINLPDLNFDHWYFLLIIDTFFTVSLLQQKYFT